MLKNIENIIIQEHMDQLQQHKHHYYKYETAKLLGLRKKNGEYIIENSLNQAITENIPSRDRSQYSQVRYKFFLDAPFEISSKCCSVMKKYPAHDFNKKSGMKPITGQMADESRLRVQSWIKNGCNGFDMKSPISNPMSFWTEQDVLEYIRKYNIQICSVYGQVGYEDELSGQMNLFDYGLNCEKCERLGTTGAKRTGCIFCGFGLHNEKGENRFDRLSKTHPKIFDYIMRGGDFAEDGLWKPDNRGLGYWFVLQWINIHGNMRIHIENYEYYEKTYGTETTRKYLYGE